MRAVWRVKLSTFSTMPVCFESTRSMSELPRCALSRNPPRPLRTSSSRCSLPRSSIWMRSPSPLHTIMLSTMFSANSYKCRKTWRRVGGRAQARATARRRPERAQVVERCAASRAAGREEVAHDRGEQRHHRPTPEVSVDPLDQKQRAQRAALRDSRPGAAPDRAGACRVSVAPVPSFEPERSTSRQPRGVLGCELLCTSVGPR